MKKWLQGKMGMKLSVKRGANMGKWVHDLVQKEVPTEEIIMEPTIERGVDGENGFRTQ